MYHHNIESENAVSGARSFCSFCASAAYMYVAFLSFRCTASALCQLERFCPMFDVVHRSFFWSVFLTLTAGFLFSGKTQKSSRRWATVVADR